MKLKTLALSVAVLAILAAVVFWRNRPRPAAPDDPRIGRPLLTPALVEQAAGLRLRDQGRTVELARAPDGAWRDRSYFGLPADFTKLAGFIGDLTAAKIQRFVTANPDRISRLELKDTRIELSDAAGHPLWSLDLGRTADSGGRFVRFGDGDRAYLANFSSALDADPKDWADPQLIALKPDDIAKLEVSFAAGPPATFMRSKKDRAWTAAKIPAGQKVSADKLSSLLSAAGSLRFTDSSDPADPQAAAARKHLRTVAFTAFDGTVTTVAFGRKPEEKQPAAPAGPVYVFITSSDPKAPINAAMARRAFQVDDYVLTSLPDKPADLFEAAAPPQP